MGVMALEKWELVSCEEVKGIGRDLLELAEKNGWSLGSLAVACRELARFLESQGIMVVEKSLKNPLN